MTQVPGGAQNLFEWIGRKRLRPAREHHRPAPRPEDVLVLRHHLHLHPRGQLDRPASPASARSAGGIRPNTGSSSTEPLLRGANADLNLTLAMALIFFALLDRVGVPGGRRARRRQGAVRRQGGDDRIHEAADRGRCSSPPGSSRSCRSSSGRCRSASASTATSSPARTCSRRWAGWCPASVGCCRFPFYFMELLVGLVQAMVFMLLTAVFTLLICQHEAHQPERTER